MIETKESGRLPWPGSDGPSDEQTARDTGSDGVAGHPGVTPHTTTQTDGDDPEAARRALAEEWRAAHPTTPDEIAHFYETAQGLGADLAAWHALPERQAWTDMLVAVAQQSGAQMIIDIGCGAGHDLRALRAVLPEDVTLCGVEPNEQLRSVVHATCSCRDSVEVASLERADLLICIDVLEHLPDPEAFLASVAQRAPVGCLLFEATATHDTGTPLHLPQNRGWHPGRCLESHGWEMVDRADRVHVWRRESLDTRQHTGLLLCAYRSVNAATLESIVGVCAGPNPLGWRLRAKYGDGMISRSRGILVTDWWRSCSDDVCLFVDDDISFDPRDADRLVQLCREGHDIICGAYSVKNGGHLACRLLPGMQAVEFGPGQAPLEIAYAATGFMAFSRRVIDALVRDMPLLHSDQTWSYYPLFPFLLTTNDQTGIQEYLSEDWAFSELARRAGFKVWMDPTIILRHAATVEVSVRNMATIRDAITHA